MRGREEGGGGVQVRDSGVGVGPTGECGGTAETAQSAPSAVWSAEEKRGAVDSGMVLCIATGDGARVRVAVAVAVAASCEWVVVTGEGGEREEARGGGAEG